MTGIVLQTPTDRDRAAIAHRMTAYYQQTTSYHTAIEHIAEDRPTPEERSFFAALARFAGRRASSDVLELGCGTADSAPTLVEMLEGKVRYVGIDASPKAIESARARHPSFDLRVGDITQLPFADDSFDICFSNYVLEHTADPSRLLAEVVRVVRPGGLLGMIVPVSDLPWLFPSSTRHLRRDPTFLVPNVLFRLVHLLRIRHDPSYFAFPLVSDPLVLQSEPAAFQPDDDQIYWSSTFEIRKWLETHGCDIAWSEGRPIDFCIANGHRPAVDLVRRILFGAFRAAMREPDRTAYTTTVCIVARKRA